MFQVRVSQSDKAHSHKRGTLKKSGWYVVITAFLKRERSILIPTAIVFTTILAFILNLSGWILGITIVFPHVFYIPIILTAYYYPRTGVLYAIGIAVAYCLSYLLASPIFHESFIAALARSFVFILIAIVVSYLSGEMNQALQSVGRLISVVQSSSDAIISVSRDGLIADWNAGAEQMYGYKASEIIGRSVADLLPPDQKSGVLELLERIHRGETIERFESPNLTSDGRIIQVSLSVSALRDPEGTIVGYSTIGHDITGLRKTEEALRKSEEKYRLVADYNYDWEFWINPEGDLVYNSPSCRYITGYQADEFARDRNLLNRIVHPEDRQIYEQHMGSVLGAPVDTRVIYFRIITKSGEVKWIEHFCQPIFGKDGEWLGRRGSNREITDRKRAEEALALANRKLALLSSVTRHDVLNQLTVVQGYLELSEGKEKDPDILDYIGKARVATGAMVKQLGFMKYYQELGGHAPEWIDVAGTIKSSATQLHFPEITIEITFKGLEVYADPLIQKVFYNLMENANRHGGHITRIGFSSVETEAGLEIICLDDGIGVPLPEREQIFERGYGKHTGLGLFLSREILAITSMTIREDGEPGKGARFVITVPKGMYRFRGEDTS